MNYKGTYSDIFSALKNFPKGASKEDFIVISGKIHVWSNSRGTWITDGVHKPSCDDNHPQVTLFKSLSPNGILTDYMGRQWNLSKVIGRDDTEIWYGPWSSKEEAWQNLLLLFNAVSEEEDPDDITSGRVNIPIGTKVRVKKDNKINEFWLNGGYKYTNLVSYGASIPDKNNVPNNPSNPGTDAGGDSGSVSGTVILDPNKTFAEQVTYPNCVYVVRDEFDLGANKTPILFPEECIILFEGGSIQNGKIKFQNTLLKGMDSECFGVQASGTLRNTDISVSSLCSPDASALTDVVASILSMDAPVTLNVDTDMTLDSSKSVNVNNLLIVGEGTINNCCSFTALEDVVVKDVTIHRNAGGNFITHRANEALAANIIFENVTFNGHDVSEAFFNAYTTSTVEMYNCQVTDCDLSHFTYYGFKVSKNNTAIIRNNHIHDFGNSTRGKSVMGIVLGQDKQYKTSLTEVTGNTVENVKGYYDVGNDTREIHAILLYGNNNKVSYNEVRNIYSIVDGQQHHCGTDAEGIYLKGCCNEINSNVLVDACGSDMKLNGVNFACDGAITLKTSDWYYVDDSHMSYNTIANNDITTRWGKAIVLDASGCTIIGNKIASTEESLYGMYVYSGSLQYSNTIKNNTLECSARTRGIITTPIFITAQEDILITGNSIIGYPTLFTLYTIMSDAQKGLIENNYIEICDVDYIAEGAEVPATGSTGAKTHNIIYTVNIEAVTYTFRKNKFKFRGVAMGENSYFVSGIANASNPDACRFIFDQNEFVFTSYNDEGSSKQTTAYRFFNAVKFLTSNEFVYEDCNINKLCYKMTNSVVTGNVFDIPSEMELPIVKKNSSDTDVAGTGIGGMCTNNYRYGIKRSGTTEERPNTRDMTNGYQYFDTTINKLISWTGAAWVDNTGATV